MTDLVYQPKGHLAVPDSGPIELSLDDKLAVWMHAKVNLTNSKKTKRAYEDTMRSFRDTLHQAGKDLDSHHADVGLLVQGWAAAGDVAPTTFNQRLAIISSFYEFGLLRDWFPRNPVKIVKRRKVQEYASAQPLNYSELQKRLAEIDQSTLLGARDLAMLSMALYTGRRLSEVCSWQWRDVLVEGQTITIITPRAKGGKRMKDKLPTPVGRHLVQWLYLYHGAKFGALAPETHLWVSLSKNAYGEPLTIQSIARICKHRLGTSKVHALRHTFARAMQEVGAPISAIQSRLGHESLDTTGRYLAALRAAENPFGEQLAALLGLDKL